MFPEIILVFTSETFSSGETITFPQWTWNVINKLIYLQSWIEVDWACSPRNEILNLLVESNSWIYCYIPVHVVYKRTGAHLEDWLKTGPSIHHQRSLQDKILKILNCCPFQNMKCPKIQCLEVSSSQLSNILMNNRQPDRWFRDIWNSSRWVLDSSILFSTHHFLQKNNECRAFYFWTLHILKGAAI
jgi:hypothetical protein